MNVPADLKYSSDHEWVKVESENIVVVGVTDYAQDALGDIVFVELPEVGSVVKASDAICEVESTKSVSDVYAPVAGTISEVNNALDDSPELVNKEPYDKGWICKIETKDAVDLTTLLSNTDYTKLTEVS